MRAGAAFTVFVSVSRFKRFLRAQTSNEPLQSDLYSDHWYRTVRMAVVTSVFLSVILVAVLLFFVPPKQCPQWHLPDQLSTSLWLPIFMLTVPVLVGLIFVVVRWRWVVQKAIESVDYPTTMPISYILCASVDCHCISLVCHQAQRWFADNHLVTRSPSLCNTAAIVALATGLGPIVVPSTP